MMLGSNPIRSCRVFLTCCSPARSALFFSHLCQQDHQNHQKAEGEAGSISKTNFSVTVNNFSLPNHAVLCLLYPAGRSFIFHLNQQFQQQQRFYNTDSPELHHSAMTAAVSRAFSSSGDHIPPSSGCSDNSDFANEAEYNDVAEETLESLTECFESLTDFMNLPQEFDVNYAQGVLTVHISKEFGTYVINKQTPNRQIWLSSPVSGPKRYDFRTDRWYYGKEDDTLHQLLDRELKEYYAEAVDKIDFSECSYSGH